MVTCLTREVAWHKESPDERSLRIANYDWVGEDGSIIGRLNACEEPLVL